MIDKRTIIIFALVGIILLGSGVYGYQQIKEKSFQDGFIAGQSDFYNQIIIGLSQDGSIIIPISRDGEIIPIRLVISEN